MIEIDESAPKMACHSAVEPTVRVSDDSLWLSYRVPTRATEKDVSALICFTHVCGWNYGYPNDEGLDSHPLYGLGLEPYQFHVTPIASHGERAWIATFHDGTFTVYARSMEVIALAQPGDPTSVIRSLLSDGPIRVL